MSVQLQEVTHIHLERVHQAEQGNEAWILSASTFDALVVLEVHSRSASASWVKARKRARK